MAAFGRVMSGGNIFLCPILLYFLLTALMLYLTFLCRSFSRARRHALLLLGALALAPCPASRAQGPIGTLDPSPFLHWQHPRPVGEQLIDLHVFNDSSAVALSNTNYAVRTTNSGRSWRYQAVGSVLGDEYPQRITFVGDTLGWVTQSYSASNNTSALRIRRTLDGGRTWTSCLQRVLFGSNSVVDLQFITRRHGFALCRQDFDFYLIRTTDGGVTWTPQGAEVRFSSVAGRYGEPTDLHFISPTEGWLACGLRAVGGLAGSILHTTDGGLTWQPQTPLGDHTVPYIAVGFARDGLHGWAFGTGTSPCYRTTNGGQQWTLMSGVYANYTQRCSVLDAQHVSIGGATTSDGGLTWTSGGASAVGFISQLQLATTGRGWGIREIGGIFRTLAYGQQWLPDSAVSQSVGVVKGFAFHGDARRGWALLGRTFPLRTTTRGRRWAAVNEGLAVPTAWQQNGGYQMIDAAAPDLDTATVLVKHRLNSSTLAFEEDLLRTTDGGQTWQVQALPPQAQYASELAFYNSRHGCAVGYDGEAYFTHDGGQTWRVAALGTTKQLSLVSWASPTRLSIAFGTSRDSLLLSDDGGRNWRKAAAPVNVLYAPVAWRTPREAWVSFGMSSALWRSTDGCRSWALVQTSVSPSQLALFPYEYRRGLVFLDSTRASARDSRPLYSADQGRTWAALSPRNNLPPGLGLLDRYNGWLGNDNNFNATYGANTGILHYSEKFLQADTLLARTPYCAGQTLALAFTRTGSFGPAEQAVVAELSDARGRFGLYPRVVGQGSTSPLAVTLPLGLPAGTQYLLRVSRPDHSVIGGDNLRGLTVNVAAPAVALAPAGPQVLCAGRSLTLAAPAGQAQYLWSTGATTRTLAVTVAGSYTVRVAAANGCFGPPSAAVEVTVVPVPAVPVLAYAAGGPVTVNAPVAGVTYQWYVNGTLQAGVSGPRFPATGPAGVGRYTAVAVSAAGGCASAASAAVVVVLAVRGALPAGWALYPNPADAFLTLELAPGAGPVQLTLTDALGRVLRALTTSAARTALDVRGLPNGLYTLQATLPNGQQQAQSVLVQH